MGTAAQEQEPVAAEVAQEPTAVVHRRLSPFEVMDRLDDDAIIRELEGIESTDLVYKLTAEGKDVINLSKAGIDECCVQLARAGEPIREESLEYTLIGDMKDPECVALFTVKAARYAVGLDGTEVKLDQVIGSKRQPLYYEPSAPLHIDMKVPGKKWKNFSFRQAMEQAEGRNYIEWMANNFREKEMRDFAQRLLDGDSTPVEGGRKLNPFWFEHGSMKAARNARIRLIPTHTRARVLALAKRTGRIAEVDERGHVENGAPPPQETGRAPSGVEHPHPVNPALAQITRESVLEWSRFAGTAIKDLAFNALEWGACVGKYAGQERAFGPRTKEWVQAMRDEISYREREAERKIEEAEEDRLRKEADTAHDNGAMPEITPEAAAEIKGT